MQMARYSRLFASRLRTQAAEFPPRSSGAFSIRSSRRRKQEPDWACRSPRASSRNMAGSFITRLTPGVAPRSPSCCRDSLKMNTRILLIEDDASAGAALQKVLRAENYEVDHV